jgi:putative lumazine-binding protein
MATLSEPGFSSTSALLSEVTAGLCELDHDPGSGHVILGRPNGLPVRASVVPSTGFPAISIIARKVIILPVHDESHPMAQSSGSWLNSIQTDQNKPGDPTMSHDRSTVEAVVQHYFDALYEGDADKLGAIFHPSADLRSLEKGELKVLTVPDWISWVRKRPSAKAEGKPREDFIVTIDRSDESTAFIKVRCQLPPRYFTDYLVAMKLADGWQIVSKSYRYDMR